MAPVTQSILPRPILAWDHTPQWGKMAKNDVK